MSEMQLQKEESVTDCVSESRKRFENFPGFEKLAHVIHHGLQGFTIKHNERA